MNDDKNSLFVETSIDDVALCVNGNRPHYVVVDDFGVKMNGWG